MRVLVTERGRVSVSKDYLDRDKKVQIIFAGESGKVYKKHPWSVPIEKVGNEFLTGQDLSTEKMTGKKSLTEEERKKFSFVLNPNNFYKSRDRQWYDLRIEEDFTLYKLILFSRMIAPSERVYKGDIMKYIGYFYDPEREAIDENKMLDLAFEAEEYIRGIPLERYEEIILLLNYKLKSNEFNITPKGISPDRQKREMINASRKWPSEILDCDPSRNKSIEEDIFILQLIHYDIISQRVNNELFYGKEYIGTTITDVKEYLRKETRIHLRQKFNALLSEKQGKISKEAAQKVLAKADLSDSSVVDQYNTYIMQLKAGIYDNNTEGMKSALEGMKKLFPELITRNISPSLTIAEAEELYNNHFPDIEGKRFREQMGLLDLEKLRAKIKHHMSNYKESECKDIWEDKDKLIDYMVKKKFS